MTIQDASGRILFQEAKALGAGSHDWSIAAPQTPGVYFVRLATADGVQRTWRWVIQ